MATVISCQKYARRGKTLRYMLVCRVIASYYKDSQDLAQDKVKILKLYVQERIAIHILIAKKIINNY